MTSCVLKAEGVVAGYGGRPVLNGIDIDLRQNEVLCLIGHNGAGKSTLLKVLFGLIPSQAGKVLIDGDQLNTRDPKTLTGKGISMVPEGRGVFPGLTVEEIMKIGMWAVGIAERDRANRIEWVLSVLPAIKQFYRQRAGTLSGGQQQMVSIARALLSKPRVLLLDEPSIGLAPKLFQDLLGPIRELQRQSGMSILLVEQNVREALKISDRVIVMKSGEIIKDTHPDELSDNAKLMELY